MKTTMSSKNVAFIIEKIVIQTEWPVSTQAYYSIYRMAVFFWILIGLTWLGGIISMLTVTGIILLITTLIAKKYARGVAYDVI